MTDGSDEQPRLWWSDDNDSADEPAQDFDEAGHGSESARPGAPPGWTAGHPGPYQPYGASGRGPWGYGPVPPWTDPAAGYGGQPGIGPAPRRRRGRGLVVAAGLAGLAAASVLGGYVGHVLTTSDRSAAASSSTTTPPSGGGFGSFPGSGSGAGTAPGSGGGVPAGGGSGNNAPTGGTGPSDAAAIASRVDPGLVDINTTVDYGQAQAAGTGMILTADGEVLTNNHVIEGATSISVTDVGNGKTYSATVLGYSVSSDVAVLQLSGASGLQTVTAAGTAPSVGEQVVGIGNAGGTGGTPSYAGGTVTAIDQSITASDDLTGTDEQLSGMLETNADIQAGDSGGPLVNDSGQVIGMDTAGSQSFQFGSDAQGSGYAIPISTAKAIASQILANHRSDSVHIGPTAFLGIQIGGAASGGPGGFGYGGYGGYGSNVAGVQLGGVVANSPAADAGLTESDVITSVGGYAVTSQSALQGVLTADLSPGQTVTIQYSDPTGQQHSVTLTLASGPPA